jgi:hypothetical protein
MPNSQDPAVAALVSRAKDWPWSSTRAHLAGEDDELATVAPLQALIPVYGASRHADRRATTRIERAPPSDARLEARMDRDARASARPPFGTGQARPKAASGAGHHAASAAAVKVEQTDM